MKFKHGDGVIREAVKDCECGTHEGPHWVHMDNLWRERNRELLKKGTLLGAMGFAKEEVFRLNQKLLDMESRGIVELIREGG